MKPIKNYNEFVNEAWIGPFVFNEDMTDDELKAIYQGALDGFAYWQKGFEYPKADYKKAYQEIGKILKKRGVNVDESAKCPPIYIPKLDNIDHTRIIKWMDIHFDSHKWDMKKSGAGFEIDVEKLSSQEQDDLLKYLHSQDYLEESVNEAVSPEVHRMVNKFVTGMADKYDYSLQDAVYAILDVLKSQKYKGLKESINEGETLIFDEIGENLTKLQDQIDAMLKWEITDQKWIVALKAIQSACSKLEDTVSKADQKLGAIEYNESLSEGTSKLDEGAVKQFEIDYKGMEANIKRGIGWIDPEYVAETWENSSDTIDYEIVRNEILTRLIKADLLYTSQDGETKGKRITNISQIK